MKKFFAILAIIFISATSLRAEQEALPAAADANADGAVNNRDVALLQQYINKWDVVLGK